MNWVPQQPQPGVNQTEDLARFGRRHLSQRLSCFAVGYNLFHKRASVRPDDDSTDFAATVASLPPGYDSVPAAGPESLPPRQDCGVDSQPAGPDSSLDAGLPDSQPVPLDLALEQGPTLAHIGRYALKGLLGAGGLGQVHEAWDPLLSRTVAVKTLQFNVAPSERVALDGLFLMIAEEEKKIRKDPVGTGSALLKKVFGGL